MARQADDLAVVAVQPQVRPDVDWDDMVDDRPLGLARAVINRPRRHQDHATPQTRLA